LDTLGDLAGKLASFVSDDVRHLGGPEVLLDVEEQRGALLAILDDVYCFLGLLEALSTLPNRTGSKGNSCLDGDSLR